MFGPTDIAIFHEEQCGAESLSSLADKTSINVGAPNWELSGCARTYTRAAGPSFPPLLHPRGRTSPCPPNSADHRSDSDAPRAPRIRCPPQSRRRNARKGQPPRQRIARVGLPGPQVLACAGDTKDDRVVAGLIAHVHIYTVRANGFVRFFFRVIREGGFR